MVVGNFGLDWTLEYFEGFGFFQVSRAFVQFRSFFLHSWFLFFDFGRFRLKAEDCP